MNFEIVGPNPITGEGDVIEVGEDGVGAGATVWFDNSVAGTTVIRCVTPTKCPPTGASLYSVEVGREPGMVRFIYIDSCARPSVATATNDDCVISGPSSQNTTYQRRNQVDEELTWRQAIEQVLSKSATPLHYTEIAERIISDGLRTNLGATPSATVNAQISGSIKHEIHSPFIRVAKGTYALAGPQMAHSVTPMNEPNPGEMESETTEEQYEIVTSFGMYWRRSAVLWSATPKLLGVQEIGATPVDFNKQLGVYLLYHEREVIYVGRTTDRPLGRRLYEHTSGRMAERWEAFSWFGLLPVSEVGDIGTLPTEFDAAKMIPALEAILIEALEPRQNRKRGDDLAAVEYMQLEDPEIEKKRALELLARLTKNMNLGA
jgi:hypothetical protein